MSKIKQLSDAIVAKIAAGEVIERPVYVVKELVENALDAGATDVHIEIEEGGLRLIKVTDNGEGMDREDVALCIKPHATSKIDDRHDLVGISSLGFRGEALASIVAVASVTIQSKPVDAVAGTKLHRSVGAEPQIESIGMSTGTQVTVEHLFSQVPARKKFLKSLATEFRLILELVTDMALGYPAVRFFLTHNGKVYLDVPALQSSLERIEEVLGTTIAKDLLAVTYDDSYLKVQGYIAKPHLVTYTNQKQYLFINGRSIRDRMVALAVKEAFGASIDPTAYPLFLLLLSAPVNVVDVNIHPRKEQVSFLEQRFMFDVVQRAVSVSLSHYSILPERPRGPVQTGEHISTHTYAASVLKDAVLPQNPLARTQITSSTTVLQIHNTYIVVPTADGFLLVDQHAAHERILLEQFAKEFHKQKKERAIVTLASPLLFDLPIADSHLLENHVDFFLDRGFDLAVTKKGRCTITAVPALFQDRDIVALIKEILEDVAAEKPIPATDIYSRRMMNFLSCRSAVKAGDPLSVDECKRLVEQLQTTPNHLTCPHGRPTYIEMSSEQLHRMFKRK